MNDYPTDIELKTIRVWKFTGTSSFVDFMKFIKSVGNYWPEESFGWKQRGRTYWISTGGWSGNEDILEAMQENCIFWSVCWVQSKRGGHFTFQLPNNRIKMPPIRIVRPLEGS